MSRKKTHEEYVAEVAEKNPNVEVVGEYINASTPILHICKVHNIEWKVIPSSILRGSGCLICGQEKAKKITTKTHEQYILDLQKINPNIEVVDNYINTSTPIMHRCLIDGYKWLSRPNNILNGCGCPMCSGNIHRTHEAYEEEVKKM